MKTSLFPKLAWTGITKNKKIYLPYILSGIGMVMMYYIVDFLSRADSVTSIKGGSNLSVILSMGKFVIAAFVLMFMLYTNSFLIRRRNKEFGLYNILGMDKKSITKIITWESLFVSVISIVFGLISGITFSKLSELALLYLTHSETNYKLAIPTDSIIFTVIVFGVVYFLLWIKSVIRVRHTDTLELMHSENTGEKPPKANWFFALVGVIALGIAYTMSVTIKSPLSAIFSFLIAVVLVIVGTYILFMAGSVALCKILQKNKKYYYKKNHFVSVSSMAYRMKRNGAGLASICILSTMVLVMIASSASLYFGADDSIKARFPQQNQIECYISSFDKLTEENISEIRNGYNDIFKKHNLTPKNVTEYTYAEITALDSDNGFDPDASHTINNMVVYDNLRQLYFTTVDEYNKVMSTNIHLNSNDIMVHTLRCSFDEKNLNLGDVKLNVIGKLDSYPEFGKANVAVIPSIMIVVSDYNVIRPLEKLADFNGDQMLDISWHYGYDLDNIDAEANEVFREQVESLSNYSIMRHSSDGTGNSFTYNASCLAEERDDFYTTFGGLFFIGILLSIIFIFAMAMIIYYKQISEGYEDQSRFEIMQKVGMTKRDIRKSINSQILTIFFAPLGFAMLHLAFAFPPIWKLLQLFNLQNLTLVLITTFIAIAVFAVFYAIIYKITARSYYNIVSEAKE